MLRTVKKKEEVIYPNSVCIPILVGHIGCTVSWYLFIFIIVPIRNLSIFKNPQLPNIIYIRNRTMYDYVSKRY